MILRQMRVCIGASSVQIPYPINSQGPRAGNAVDVAARQTAYGMAHLGQFRNAFFPVDIGPRKGCHRPIRDGKMLATTNGRRWMRRRSGAPEDVLGKYDSAAGLPAGRLTQGRASVDFRLCLRRRAVRAPRNLEDTEREAEERN